VHDDRIPAFARGDTPGRDALLTASREPEEIYEETRKEGRRRLSRPVVELAATALVGGFDVAFLVAAYGLCGGRGRG
jgi:hypothetical protein